MAALTHHHQINPLDISLEVIVLQPLPNLNTFWCIMRQMCRALLCWCTRRKTELEDIET